MVSSYNSKVSSFCDHQTLIVLFNAYTAPSTTVNS